MSLVIIRIFSRVNVVQFLMDDLLQAAGVLNDNEIIYLHHNNFNKKANCQPVFIVNFDY